MTKTWLITGSSRGFGRELAKAALNDGDRVVATARRPEQLKDLVLEYGDRVRAVALDVTDAEAAGAAVQTAIHEFGTLDVVVNNAGYANSSPIEETPDDDFRAQIETNLFGVVNLTKVALPMLHKQRSGIISSSFPPSVDASAARRAWAPTRPRSGPSKAFPRFSATR